MGALVAALLVLLVTGSAAAQIPDGQIVIAFDASIAPTFLDPAETSGLGTPFAFLYALHDAVAKPLPGNPMAPCLAESWKEVPTASSTSSSCAKASSSTTATPSPPRT